MSFSLSRTCSMALVALGLLACAPRLADAQAVNSADPAVEARLRAMEEQVRALSAELAALRGAAPVALKSDNAELEAKVDALTEEVERGRHDASGSGSGIVRPLGESVHGLGPAASKVYGSDHGVSIGGYGEMLYEGFASDRDDGSPATSKDKLDLLRVVLYTGYKFNDHILFNSELEVEHATTGEGAEEKGEVSLEQAYLDFRFNDHAGLRAGLMLMPMGFINEMHEPTTFLGARRPEVERRIIPSTWREPGVGFFGTAGRVSYRSYLVTGLNSEGFSAGSGLRDGRQAGSNSLAEDFAFVARVDVEATDWLTLGGSGYTGGADQDVKTPLGETIDARVALWELHAQVRFKGLDFRALWAEVDIDDVALINEANGLVGDDSVGSQMEGWYASAGYDVLAHRETEQELIPFIRYEAFDTQSEVPGGFFRDPANDRSIWTFGFSYKPHPQVVIKVDWQDIDNAAGTGTDQFNVGVGYTF